MFQLAFDAHLRAEVLRGVWFANRSRRAVSRIRADARGRGGGRLGGRVLNNQSFFKMAKKVA